MQTNTFSFVSRPQAMAPGFEAKSPLETFVPSMTEATHRLAQEANPSDRNPQFKLGFNTSRKFSTEDFIRRSEEFQRLVLLDQSSQDRNPACGQVELPLNTGEGEPNMLERSSTAGWRRIRWAPRASSGGA